MTTLTGRIGSAGQSLESAIAEAINSTGATSGNGTLQGCALSTTRFTTGGPARDGKAANYTFIRDWDAAELLSGTFTFGLDEVGAPFVHCHAIIDAAQETNLVAGHLFPKECTIAAPFAATINLMPDLTLTQQNDIETLHSVFNISDSDGDNDDALFVRVRPNEDITLAVEVACKEAGVADVDILPSVGSLNAPTLDSGVCESVGMEVIAFTGTVNNGVASVHAQLCNEDGALFGGQIVRGGASVCVTAELVLAVRN